MLLRSKPYDHILQLSTITCPHNNKLQGCSADFLSLSSIAFDFKLTLTLIINTDLLSVPTTRIDSNLSEVRNFGRIYSIPSEQNWNYRRTITKQKELANSVVIKVVNRITSQSATCDVILFTTVTRFCYYMYTRNTTTYKKSIYWNKYY